MKTLKSIVAVSLFAAFLAVSSFAQQQGAQTLSTTTLSSALTNVGSGNISSVTLASLTNVTATVSIGTRLWVDTEAMDVVTNSIPPSGTTILVQRGASGTKAESHASGRTVYVSRPNLFQGYDQAGTCWTDAAGTILPTILPWINITSGNRYDCKSDGVWFKSGFGSQSSAAITTASAFCTTTLSSGATAYLNGTACASSSTATFRYTVAVNGELHGLRVYSSASETATAGDPVTVYKNGSATTITCTILVNTATCNDSTHAVAVIPGDTLTFNVTGATSAAAANLSASVNIYGQ